MQGFILLASCITTFSLNWDFFNSAACPNRGGSISGWLAQTRLRKEAGKIERISRNRIHVQRYTTTSTLVQWYRPDSYELQGRYTMYSSDAVAVMLESHLQVFACFLEIEHAHFNITPHGSHMHIRRPSPCLASPLPATHVSSLLCYATSGARTQCKPPPLS